MNNFHFMRPEWFLVLPPLLFLLFWLARRQRHSRSWQAVCDPELLPHLLLGRSVRRANWPLWLLLVGLFLAVLALAGPVWQRQPQPLYRQQSALVILFDLSRSMLVADLKPSRLLRARLKIEDILRQRQEGQTALIVFAADAFTVTPLTEDRHTIEALLESLDPEMMPVQGSNSARAIVLGQTLLQQAGLRDGRILLVTDEDRPELSIDAAHELAQQGFELMVLGVGSPEGAPIPLAGGGFFKDAQGNLVLPKLAQPGLRELAIAGGGTYQKLSIDDSDLQVLLADLGDQSLNQIEQADRSSRATGDLWREEGIWLLWPLSLLGALAFRRGWLLVLTLVLLTPPPAMAISWPELWQTSDQLAAQAFDKQDYARAAQQFQDSRWKASALYRAGDFGAAAKQLGELQTADDWYNQGNALAKSGDLTAALKSYQQALEIDPAHTDAQINKELIEKAMQQLDQQKKQGRNKGQQGDQKEKTGEGADESQDQKAMSDDGQEKQGKEKMEQNDSDDNDDKPQSAKPSTQSSDVENENEQTPDPAESSPSQAENAITEQSEGKSGTASALPGENPETAEERESRLLLQQIPDDPGGLLRRKFLYQYRQRGQQSETDRSW